MITTQQVDLFRGYAHQLTRQGRDDYADAIHSLLLDLQGANRRVAELERLRLEYSNSVVFDKLDALAMFWRIDVRPSDKGGANVVLLLRYCDEVGDIAAEFTGTLRDAIMQADAWFDGVEFAFSQEGQPL